jgi:hypothetical protein
MLDKTIKMGFGAELELGDVDRNITLPHNNQYDNLDYTVVSSNGYAIDPKSKYHKIGAEINTQPVYSIDDFRDNVNDIVSTIGTATPNYRCATHIHVSCDELNDLDTLKRFFRYLYDNQQQWRDTITNVKRYKGISTSLNNMMTSANKLMPQRVFEATQNATTREDVRRAYGVKNNGEYYSFLIRRYGINGYSLFKNGRGTVEFRTFKSTKDPKMLTSIVELCARFVQHAITDQKPFKEWYQPIELPQQQPLDEYLEYGWQKTNHRFKQSEHPLRLNTNIEEALATMPTREEFNKNKDVYMQGFNKWRG